MNNQKNTVYLVIFLIFILSVLVGWFVIRGKTNTNISPSVPHAMDATNGASITILEPVPSGNPADHSESGWKKIKGIIPVQIVVAEQVEKVIFYLDRTIVGEKISPPFDFALDTAKYKDCMYLLRVKAYDAQNKELGEDRSQIWIDNTPSNC